MIGRKIATRRSCLAHASLRSAALLVATMLLGNACGSAIGTAGPTDSRLPAISSPASAAPSGPRATGSASPSVAASGFAFAAEDVIRFYEDAGYACTAREPSTKAAGFFVRQCEIVDGAGRTRVVGVVTDPAGVLANGYASVQGPDAEVILAPIDALEPLAGFLGAMLGEDRGSTVLPWLAGHLGDAYAETTIELIRVATYSESEVDHSRLYLELANQAYLEAPSDRAP